MPESCCDGGYVEQADGSMAPCPTHRANVYARWIGGHLSGDHDPEGCQGCRDASRGRAQRPAVKS